MAASSFTLSHASESPFDTSMGLVSPVDQGIYTAKQIADFVLSIAELTDNEERNAQNLASKHGILDNWTVPEYVNNVDEIYSFGCVLAIAHFYNKLSDNTFQNKDIPPIYEKCVRAVNSLTYFLQTPRVQSSRLPGPVKLSLCERWKLDRAWDISVCLLGAIKARCGFQRRIPLGGTPIVHDVHYRRAAEMAMDFNNRFGKGRVCQKVLGLLTREEIEPFVQPMCLVNKLQYNQDIDDPFNHFNHTNCTVESCRFDVEEPDDEYHIPGCLGCGKSKPQDATLADSQFREITNSNHMPAVGISDPKCYWVAADSDTLVVSHLWRDGIWGTRDDGINKCIHDYLVRVARDNGCTSYWIDCGTIPKEEENRKAMIMRINWTFMNAKLVLCWDRKLASLDPNPETMLLSLIVSAWHRRAWTLLEGNRALQKRIAFFRWLNTTDASYELFHLSNMLDSVFKGPGVPLWIRSAMVELLPYSDMALSVDAAGLLLSGRHASRDGDSEVIWGLIRPLESRDRADDINFKNPYAHARNKVDVAFISSNAVRFNDHGMPSWRPGRTDATAWVRTAYGGIKADIIDAGSGRQYLRGMWWAKVNGNIEDLINWNAVSPEIRRRGKDAHHGDVALICPILMGDPRSNTPGRHATEPVEGFFRTSVVMECKRAIFITRKENDDAWLWQGMVRFNEGRSLFFTVGEAQEFTIGGC